MHYSHDHFSFLDICVQISCGTAVLQYCNTATETPLTVMSTSLSTNLYQKRLRLSACLLDYFLQSMYVCAAMERIWSMAVHFCRPCRRNEMERKLEEENLPEEQQNYIIKNMEKKETEYMRLQRHKMGADDFDLLTIIGRGAFGEVRSPRDTWHAYTFHTIPGASDSMCVKSRMSRHVTSCSSTSSEETGHHRCRTYALFAIARNSSQFLSTFSLFCL